MTINDISGYSSVSALLYKMHLDNLIEKAHTRTAQEARTIACPPGTKRPAFLHACRPASSSEDTAFGRIVFHCSCGAFMFEGTAIWIGRNVRRYPRLVAFQKRLRSL